MKKPRVVRPEPAGALAASQLAAATGATPKVNLAWPGETDQHNETIVRDPKRRAR
jgi:hypothetical protein